MTESLPDAAELWLGTIRGKPVILVSERGVSEPLQVALRELLGAGVVVVPTRDPALFLRHLATTLRSQPFEPKPSWVPGRVEPDEPDATEEAMPDNGLDTAEGFDHEPDGLYCRGCGWELDIRDGKGPHAARGDCRQCDAWRWISRGELHDAGHWLERNPLRDMRGQPQERRGGPSLPGFES